MGRAVRIEFCGALYHVMSRENWQDNIFLQDRDYRLFLNTLEEASEQREAFGQSYFDTMILGQNDLAEKLYGGEEPLMNTNVLKILPLAWRA